MPNDRLLGVAWGLFAAHVAFLLFGLTGLLIFIPNPRLWAGDPFMRDAFTLGMGYGGALHLVLGAATMVVYGLAVFGPRRTAIFGLASTLISLGFELLGTGIGWPFGAYAYREGLGLKIHDQVPYTIPLSWFYVGFAAYLLANVIAAKAGLRPRLVWGVTIGVWLLTAWDLVLDPAMAHESLPLKFWVWQETGPYFGMPVRNFAGWALTGLCFMLVSRLLWGADPDPSPRRLPPRLPFGIYAINTAFAAGISLSIGLWQPVVAALLLGVLPAALALPGPWPGRPVASARVRGAPAGR